VLARSGWASAFFWVLRMGSRFAFIFWITHSGAASIADFSVQHAITGSAWTVGGARDGGVRSGRPLGVDGGSPSASARPPRFRVRLTPLPSLAVFTNLTGRTALTIRLIGLALVSWTVLTASHHPAGDSGRGLVLSVLFVVCVVAWLTRIRSPTPAHRAIRAVPDRGLTPEIWVLAAAGGVLCSASPNSAASAFVFVAVVAAGVRAELLQAFIVVGLAVRPSARMRSSYAPPAWRSRRGSRGRSTTCSPTRSPA